MKVNTQLRQESIKKVLFEIRKNGPISKRELQTATGFSWGNISSITTRLMNEKYIMASGKQETYVGRKPEEFDININDNYIIGIDFNSEGVLLVVCDLKGRVVSRYDFKFLQKDKDYAVSNLFDLVEKAISQNKSKNISYIAVAMQGEVDTENGISVKISGIKDWKNIPVCKLLKERFGIETVMLHDPDCLLYTEKNLAYLCDKSVNNAILLRIDHGIGIAVMLGGNMYMGNKSKTCEIDKTVVPQKCGGWSLVRNLVSDKSVENIYFKDTNDRKSCSEIADLAHNGDEKAKEIFENLGTALAFALNNASGLLNPETVILFGDFVKYSPLFLSSTENLLKQLLGDECPEIVLSTLNNDAAAVGATLFATDKFIEKLKFID